MDVTGADFSGTVVERCRKTYLDADFVECDASQLPFEDSSFDYVVAVHVMENLDDEKLAMAVSEMRRVLRTGGYLFVRCFTPEDMRSGDRRNGFFYRYFTLDDILALFDDMDVVSSEKKDEPTRFGTVRSRVECLFRKK